MTASDNSGVASPGRPAPASAVFQRIERAFDAVVRWIELALAVLFIFAVALNFINVVDRYLFKRSILGADEVQIYIMIWTTFVGAAIVTWRHQHLRMDVLLVRFPHWIRLALLAVELALALGLAIMMVVQSTRYAFLMAVLDRRSDMGGIPMWVPHGALGLGFALIGAITVWRGIELASHRAKPERHPSEARL
jgi:TRAP-type C4-dicarboxylate transport system permease small subunit